MTKGSTSFSTSSISSTACAERLRNCTEICSRLCAEASIQLWNDGDRTTREIDMIEKVAPLAHGEIDVLILQALVRKLVVKGVLSPDDVRALLFDAATRLDLVGSDLTPEAARVIVEEDLAPAFLGS